MNWSRRGLDQPGRRVRHPCPTNSGVPWLHLVDGEQERPVDDERHGRLRHRAGPLHDHGGRGRGLGALLVDRDEGLVQDLADLERLVDA